MGQTCTACAPVALLALPELIVTWCLDVAENKALHVISDMQLRPYLVALA